MSYLDQSRRRNPAGVAAVVGVHALVGYALLVGLGYTVIPYVPQRTIVFTVPTVPPPPAPKPIERQQVRQPVANPIPQPDDSLKADPTPIRPTLGEGPVGTLGGGGGGPVVLPPADPPRPSQAADAVPAKDRLRWITNEDYPAGLIRQNVQGVVAISVTIDATGKVRSCLVTQSSGNQQLDDTTCRLYARRAHFTPARDADGNPTTAQRIDRFRWQIPNE